jgi:hypothetical protein
VHACRAGSVDVVNAVLYVDDAVMQAQAPQLCARVLSQTQRVWQTQQSISFGPAALQAVFHAAQQITSASVALAWLAALERALAQWMLPPPRAEKQSLHPLQQWFHTHWALGRALVDAQRRCRAAVRRPFAAFAAPPA